MKLNAYLCYELDEMAPQGLWDTFIPITPDQALLHLEATIPDGTTMVFILLGQTDEDGVSVLDLVPMNVNAIDGVSLVVDATADTGLQPYALNALEELIGLLNEGKNNNPGLAPTASFEYNRRFYQWSALSIKHLKTDKEN